MELATSQQGVAWDAGGGSTMASQATPLSSSLECWLQVLDQ